MNVSLSFNNRFKWGGPRNIKWGSPLGYPNHILTFKEEKEKEITKEEEGKRKKSRKKKKWKREKLKKKKKGRK
jgi:hypothetical protein